MRDLERTLRTATPTIPRAPAELEDRIWATLGYEPAVEAAFDEPLLTVDEAPPPTRRPSRFRLTIGVAAVAVALVAAVLDRRAPQRLDGPARPGAGDVHSHEPRPADGARPHLPRGLLPRPRPRRLLRAVPGRPLHLPQVGPADDDHGRRRLAERLVVPRGDHPLAPRHPRRAGGHPDGRAHLIHWQLRPHCRAGRLEQGRRSRGAARREPRPGHDRAAACAPGRARRLRPRRRATSGWRPGHMLRRIHRRPDPDVAEATRAAETGGTSSSARTSERVSRSPTRRWAARSSWPRS